MSAVRTCESSSPCRAASIRRSPRRCSPSRATTSSACRCSSTIRAIGRSLVRQLLHARRSSRRAARRGGDRHPALHPELRAAVRRAGRLEFRQRVHGRPHAASVRALQQRPEVRHAARARARLRRRRGRHRATTRASSAIAPPDATPAEARRRSVEGPVLFPVLADAGAAGARRLPGRRSLQGRRARLRATPGLPVADKPDSQEICFIPDDDYAAFVAQRTHRTPRATARSSTSRDACSAATRHPPVHRRPAQGARPAARPTGAPMYVLALDAGRAAGRRRPEGVARAHDADGVRRELDCTRAGDALRASPRRSATGIAPRRRASRALERRARRGRLRRAADRGHARSGGRLLRRRCRWSAASDGFE